MCSRSPVLVQFEKGRLRSIRRRLPLFAPYAQQVAPQMTLAVDLQEFRNAHVSVLRAGVPAQRCAAPLPVGETGGSKGKGGVREGDHPPGGPRRRSGSARPRILSGAGRPGIRGRPVRQAHAPLPARGAEPPRSTERTSSARCARRHHHLAREIVTEGRDPATSDGARGARRSGVKAASRARSRRDAHAPTVIATKIGKQESRFARHFD